MKSGIIFTMKTAMPSIEDIRRYFDYLPSGHLAWKIKPNKRIVVGGLAGCITPSGYVQIIFQRVHIGAHRLIWAWHNGDWPKHDIDHVNMDRSDNRIENLRQATRSQNKYNTAKQVDNTSGYKGVDFHKRRSIWRARISVSGKVLYLGAFNTSQEAASAYNAAACKYHGEFARLA